MKENAIRHLREHCLNASVFPDEILTWLAQENLWNLWVPKKYGGLETSFGQGLRKLKTLAKIDGSLGWTVTLCSGANYFVGNLKKNAAQEIFLNDNSPILGGSGGAFGTAEKQGEHYKISGKWRYATGANYLSHFTLNAKITAKGKELKNTDGSPKVRSFILPKKDVEIIEDWNTMGLLPTVTHSFTVNEAIVDEKFSFLYDRFHLPQAIYKIPFLLFADLTLWVNYSGMAEHFLEEAKIVLPAEKLSQLQKTIAQTNETIFSYAEEIEKTTESEGGFTQNHCKTIHQSAVQSVRKLSRCIIELYPFLGIKASRKNHQLNQVFRDYFTATQHFIFVEK